MYMVWFSDRYFFEYQVLDSLLRLQNNSSNTNFLFTSSRLCASVLKFIKVAQISSFAYDVLYCARFFFHCVVLMSSLK